MGGGVWGSVGHSLTRSVGRSVSQSVSHSVGQSSAASPRRYPLFQLGGPQLRIFRPNFFMLAVRPGVPQPEDTVQFRVSMQ